MKESKELFDFLNEIEVEYHKKYTRYNKEFKVPRGQASFREITTPTSAPPKQNIRNSQSEKKSSFTSKPKYTAK